ncbi:MAG: polymer-forming cytoskeletal protein [Verrucomicrobia bacterium]|nr:polymer-forming cytoskeletal protein [Verrucomicrobiota bacterium]
MSGPTPQSAGKVARTCPQCGFKQLESPYAKSTFCRKCGEHYEPGKAKPILRNERPSLLSKVGAFLSRHKTRQITCFDCAAVQTVSSSSSSSICPQCSAYIDLSDFKINTVYSRVIQTQGTVTIDSKADVTSSKVACREAYVKGKLRGNLLCTGTAHIKWKGKITGSLEASHIEIAKRSEVEFVRTVKARSMEIAGKVSANLQVEGTVKITKRGRLDGTIYAKGIVVEKGGIFLGELVIAPATLHPQTPPSNPVQKQPAKARKQSARPSPAERQPDLGLDV